MQSNAIKFNLRRSKIEYEEASRRLKWFKKKYLGQKNLQNLLFLHQFQMRKENKFFIVGSAGLIGGEICKILKKKKLNFSTVIRI